MAAQQQQKQKTFHEEFREITEQIKRLEQMQIENTREIRKRHSRNAALKETIEQLKAKRRQLFFLDMHIEQR